MAGPLWDWDTAPTVPIGMFFIWWLSIPVILTLLGRTGPPIQVQSSPATVPLAPRSMSEIGTPLDLLPLETLYVASVGVSVVTSMGSTPELVQS